MLRLLPLLDFGRDRDGIDLYKVVLTHHRLNDQGRRTLTLNEEGGEVKLQPLTLHRLDARARNAGETRSGFIARMAVQA